MAIIRSRALPHGEPAFGRYVTQGSVATALCIRKPPTSAAILALVLAGVSLLVMVGCTPHVAVATVAASGIVAADLRLRLS